jgi:hypothetical protein
MCFGDATLRGHILLNPAGATRRMARTSAQLKTPVKTIQKLTFSTKCHFRGLKRATSAPPPCRPRAVAQVIYRAGRPWCRPKAKPRALPLSPVFTLKSIPGVSERPKNSI